MYYQAVNDWRNYLAHHGVQGMKWGVRRYQPYGVGYERVDGKTGKNIGAAKKGETGFVKRMKIRGAYLKKNFTVIPEDVKAAKTWHRKVSAVVGHQHAKTMAIERAKTQHELANASKTKLGKTIHDTKRVNAQYEAVYQQKVLNMKLGQRAVETVIPKTAFNKPVATLGGRTTKQGLVVARNLLDSATGGSLGSMTTVGLDMAAMAQRRSASRRGETPSRTVASFNPSKEYTTEVKRWDDSANMKKHG